jgi:hypothetical protein
MNPSEADAELPEWVKLVNRAMKGKLTLEDMNPLREAPE